MSLMDLLVEWTQIEKESLSWMIYQWNPQKTKKKKKRRTKTQKKKLERDSRTERQLQKV